MREYRGTGVGCQVGNGGGNGRGRAGKWDARWGRTSLVRGGMRRGAERFFVHGGHLELLFSTEGAEGHGERRNCFFPRRTRRGAENTFVRGGRGEHLCPRRAPEGHGERRTAFFRGGRGGRGERRTAFFRGGRGEHLCPRRARRGAENGELLLSAEGAEGYGELLSSTEGTEGYGEGQFWLSVLW